MFLTASQAKRLDTKLMRKLGIPALVLMENAGRAVAEEAAKIGKGKKRIAIFCGTGNNGGDGFVCARHLLLKGIRPQIFLTGRLKVLSGQASINAQIARRLGIPITEVSPQNLPRVRKALAAHRIIIDALVGVGARGEVRAIVRDCIESINSSKAFVVAVDIPSGLCATTGKVLGIAVKADMTVTFLARKKGMRTAAGKAHCGKVIIRDLGVSVPPI